MHVTSCEELTHWKRPWCWEGLGAGGKGGDRGWDGWMASLTRWTWVWVNSGSWWWTRRPGVLWFMGSQRVRHDWATELNWPELNACQTTNSRPISFTVFAKFCTYKVWLVECTQGWLSPSCPWYLVILQHVIFSCKSPFSSMASLTPQVRAPFLPSSGNKALTFCWSGKGKCPVTWSSKRKLEV